MQKVKDLLHVHSKDNPKEEHYGTAGGHGRSERTGTGSTGATNPLGGTSTGGLGSTNQSGTTTQGRAGGIGGPTHGVGSNKNIDGVGAGTDQRSAKEAAKEAAHQNRDVNIQTQTGAAQGKPVGTGSHSGVTSGATHGHTSGVNTSGVRGTGTHTGVGTGTHTGVGTGTHTGVGTGHHTGVETEGGVIDRKYYTGTEDRPQDEALVEKFREHNPYAKEYETTVQHTGRERQIGSELEHLGTEERVIGQDNLVGNPHHKIAAHLPKGAVETRPGGEGWVQGQAGPICDSTEFTVTGDRTVDKERVTNMKQHREFEKEFEVATHLKGERAVGGTKAEVLDRERILLDEKKKNPCAGHPNI